MKEVIGSATSTLRVGGEDSNHAAMEEQHLPHVGLIGRKLKPLWEVVVEALVNLEDLLSRLPALGHDSNAEVGPEAGMPERIRSDTRSATHLTRLEVKHPWVVLNGGDELLLGSVQLERNELRLLVNNPEVPTEVTEVSRAAADLLVLFSWGWQRPLPRTSAPHGPRPVAP